MSDAKQPRDGRFIASAAIIGLIVLAGIIAVVLRLTGGESDGDTATPPAQTSSSGAASSSCGLPDGDQTVPTTAPATDWYFIGPIAAPRSEEIGPKDSVGDVATCFARSPAGALFAAGTLVAETFPNDASAEKAARERMVPNQALEDSLNAASDQTRFPAQIVGFKFVDYTKERTSLTIASRLTAGPNAGALGSLTMTMVWRDGDWWWELQPSTTATAIASLEGFTLWSGVS